MNHYRITYDADGVAKVYRTQAESDGEAAEKFDMATGFMGYQILSITEETTEEAQC